MARSDGPRVWIDSSGCRLKPKVRSFRAILRLANDPSFGEIQSALPVEPTMRSRRPRRRVSAKSLERLWEANRQVERVLKEEGIPHSPPSCAAYGNPLGLGTIYMFEGDCYDRRLNETVEIHNVKELVRREYVVGHPVREVVLSLNDTIPAAEVPMLFRVISCLSSQ
ncbi:MAG: hypothetical protein L3J97_00610 [Thermoplasmata archaeon]|nr:hypothetical protein [Thermoplasmata archaeon]